MAGKHGFHFDSRLLEHIESGRADEAKAMLNEDLISASDESKNTLLHYAVLGNSDDIVRHLIELGADVGRPGKDGNTPLMLSIQRAEKSFDDFVDTRTNVITNNDAIAAIRMVLHMRVKILMLLINGLQSQTVDIEELVDKLVAVGCNVMHCVMYLRNEQVQHATCRFMLQRGFDVNAKDRHGMTALRAAVSINNVSLVKLLIDNGADVNALNVEGITPLSAAAYIGNKEMLEILLVAGAHPNVTGISFEFTAIFIIFKNARNVPTEETDECLDLLFQHGAIPQNPSQLLDIASKKNDSKKINMLINYLVMLKELGRPIADSDFHCKQEELRSTIPASLDSCQKFLSNKVYGNLTMLKLLTDCENKMRTRVRYENLVSKLQQLLSNDENKRIFPYYCSTLAKQISKAVAIVKFEDTAIPIMCELLNCSYNQCYNFAREIVGYLGEKDLEQLCQV